MRRTFWVAPLVVVIAFAGCKARKPGAFEERIVWGAKRHLFVGNKSQKNPLQASAETIADGKEAFSHYCVACHGMDGQNTGVPFADQMSPPAAPLNSPAVQSYTDGQLHWILVNGISPSGMPASKGILTDSELWSIVLFIRHLPPAGSLGEPAFYSGDDRAPCRTSSAQE